MELKGRVKFLGQLAEGVSATGNGWQRQDFVIDYVSGKDKEGEKIVKQAAFQGFGNVVDIIKGLNIGDIVSIQFNIEAREYNGKWYGTNSVWKIEPLESKKGEAPKPTPKPEPIEEKDDLPF